MARYRMICLVVLYEMLKSGHLVSYKSSMVLKICPMKLVLFFVIYDI